MSAWTLPESGPLLGMYGSDHTAPATDAPDLLAAAGKETGIGVRLATLAAFFEGLPAGTDGLPLVHGELRSHARANILPGVNSIRPELKRAMSHAERWVERYAEPMAALYGDGGEQRFLDMAWQRLIAVSCHDSVTGCGCDETAVQVGARMAEAEQLGQAVCDLIGQRRAAAVPQDALLVFNPRRDSAPAWSSPRSTGRVWRCSPTTGTCRRRSRSPVSTEPSCTGGTSPPGR